MAVSQHAQYQDSETEAAKWNSAISRFIYYISAFYYSGVLERLW